MSSRSQHETICCVEDLEVDVCDVEYEALTKLEW